MKVLIATDGSELAVHAATRAAQLLGPPSEVVVLAVVTDVPGDEAGGFEGPVETPEEQEQTWNEEQSDANAAIAAIEGALGSWATNAKGRIEVGDAGGVICVVAEETDADVVVVGSHGKGVLKRVFLGSVSEHVLRHAPCPVLVVRRGAEGGDESETRATR